MTKKWLLICSVVCFFFSSIDAQEVALDISDHINIDGAEMIQDHLLATEDGHYMKMVKFKAFKSGQLFIQKYSNQFKLLFSKPIELKNKEEEASDFYAIKNQVLLLTVEKNKKKDFIQYNFVPIDRDGNLQKSKKIGKFTYEKRKDEPNIEVTHSQDTTMHVFSAHVDNDDDEDKFSIYTSVIDNNLNEKWDGKTTFRKSQKEMKLLSTAVNSLGQVYYLIKEYKTPKAKEKISVKGEDAPGYAIKIIKIDSASVKSPEEYLLDNNDLFIANARLTTMPNGDIGVVGMTSSTKQLFVNGIILVKINAETGEVYGETQKKFSAKDIAQLKDEKNTSKDGDKIGLSQNFDIINITYLKNGTTKIALEDNYSVTSYRNNGFGYASYSTTTMFSKDIIGISVDKEGQISHLTIVPKQQSEGETDYLIHSVAFANEEGQHFVYNENKDNLKKPIGEKQNYFTGSNNRIVLITTITNDGNIIRTPLFDKEEAKAIFMPKFSRVINDRQVFFVAQDVGAFKIKDRRIGLITLQ